MTISHNTAHKLKFGNTSFKDNGGFALFDLLATNVMYFTSLLTIKQVIKLISYFPMWK